MIMSPSDSARKRQMPGWRLGHLTYGENAWSEQSGSPEKPGTGGAASPCRAYYMLTAGIIHGQTGLTPCKGVTGEAKSGILRLKGQFRLGYEFRSRIPSALCVTPLTASICFRGTSGLPLICDLVRVHGQRGYRVLSSSKQLLSDVVSPIDFRPYRLFCGQDRLGQ